MKVHILATCRRPELIDGTLLVFRTIRTGFPAAEVHVWGNDLPYYAVERLNGACRLRNCELHLVPRIAHDAWLEAIVFNEPQPVWVLDTDLVFFDKVEDWRFDAPFAGRYEPEFAEPITQSIRPARLDPAMMWMNPAAMRVSMRAILGRLVSPFAPTMAMPLIRQTMVPRMDGPPLFYDTLTGLYQCGVGQPFSDEQNRCYEHLHCGTYVDQAGAVEKLRGLPAVHAAVWEDHSRARGLQTAQNQFYHAQRTLPQPVGGKDNQGITSREIPSETSLTNAGHQPAALPE